MIKVLVVDPDYKTRESLLDILQLCQYQTFGTNNIEEGFKIAVNENPNIIISDTVFGKTDGIQFIHKLKSSQISKKIPIIFHSSEKNYLSFRKYMDHGALDFVYKPSEEGKIIGIINMRLEHLNPTKISKNIAIETFNPSEVFSNFEVEKYKPNDRLELEEIQSKFIYYIQKGSIKTYSNSITTRHIVFDFHYAKEFIGFSNFFIKIPFCFNIKFLEDTILLKIKGTELENLLKINPNYFYYFTKHLAKDKHLIQNRLIQLSNNTTNIKIAKIILHLSSKTNKDVIVIKRLDMAAIVGVAVESVSRAISNLSKRGLIQSRARTIKILNKRELVEYADYDDDYNIF